MSDLEQAARAKIIAARLDELALAVANGDRSEFTMRVPAQPDRDADLVLSEAARLLRTALAAEGGRVSGDPVLWLWKNGPHEYWAFDNAYPCYGNGDPMTLGEPVGYALLKQSTNGRPDVTHSDVVRGMLAAAQEGSK